MPTVTTYIGAKLRTWLIHSSDPNPWSTSHQIKSNCEKLGLYIINVSENIIMMIQIIIMSIIMILILIVIFIISYACVTD